VYAARAAWRVRVLGAMEYPGRERERERERGRERERERNRGRRAILTESWRKIHYIRSRESRRVITLL